MLRLGALDADLAAMLLRMARGVLQDTVLLLLSDHGTHGIWYTEYEIGATCAPLPFESDRLPSRRVALAASEGGPVQLGSIYAHGEVMPLQAISSDLEQSQISRATPSVSCTPTPPPPSLWQRAPAAVPLHGTARLAASSATRVARGAARQPAAPRDRARALSRDAAAGRVARERTRA